MDKLLFMAGYSRTYHQQRPDRAAQLTAFTAEWADKLIEVDYSLSRYLDNSNTLAALEAASEDFTPLPHTNLTH